MAGECSHPSWMTTTVADVDGRHNWRQQCQSYVCCGHKSRSNAND